ncbi:DUF5672 family protein [Salinimicrobium xinjiangense]|uniref:DUF5672 family protein n=1 Tax=Salinimicrobium xinjiangense TaxID=438596 RepID=UPI00040B21E5|nr:DUF5672 family protein [Salinimicrobium xinjiangense]
MRIAVVIPCYKNELNALEERSLNQCLKVLKDYKVIFAIPEGLEVKQKPSFIKTEEFDKEYFKNISGYNKLMLTSDFYKRFLGYDYVLIYQLDAFVFRDELRSWCQKGYDYIGAPWIATRNLTSSLLRPFKSKSLKKREPIFYKVGNGGFSLRKTKAFYEISEKLKQEIKEQLDEKQDEIYSIEDVFWSLKVPEFFPEFKIPGYEEAVGFAIDRKPELALKLNNNQLPFGCHGIDKPKVKNFWEPIIEREFRKTD